MGDMPPQLTQAIQELEVPLGDEQQKAIGLANTVTNDYLTSLGVESHDLPVKNFHLLPRAIYRALSNGVPSDGHGNTFFQSVFLDHESFKDTPLSVFASTALHEMIQIKGPSLIWISKANPAAKPVGDLTQRRWGMSVMASKPGESTHMEGLEEAIVTDIQKMLFGQMFMNRIFKKDRDESAKSRLYRQELAKRNNIPVDEVFWATLSGKLLNGRRFPYYQPRVILSYICDEIYKTHSEQYKNISEVRKKFHEARFTLDLIEVARLINDTFGEQGLRTIASMRPGLDPNPSAIQTLERLKSLRSK
jgi:hypothetical protein